MRNGSGVPLCAVLAALTTCINAAEPVGWRADGHGRFTDASPPLEWSNVKNVAWKCPTDKGSNASPVLVGERIFICAEPNRLVCVAAETGEILWERANPLADVAAGEPDAEAKAAEARELEKQLADLRKQHKDVGKQLKKAEKDEAPAAERKELEARKAELDASIRQVRERLEPLALFRSPPNVHNVNGYSSPTPVSDGDRVYVVFATGVAAAYDLEGERQWIRFLRRPTLGWGHCSSPILVGGVFVVHMGDVFGLDPDSGETVWRAESGGRFGTPAGARIGETDVVVTAGGDVFRADDGAHLVTGMKRLTYNGPIVQDGVAYFIEHGGGAYRLPEDVPEETIEAERIWETKPSKERYYASPLLDGDVIYAVQQKGVLSAISVEDGSVLEERKLDLKGTMYSSPTLAGRHIFVFAESGRAAVLKLGPELEVVGTAELRGEKVRACPLFDGRRMYVRGTKHLWCFEKPGGEEVAGLPEWAATCLPNAPTRIAYVDVTEQRQGELGAAATAVMETPGGVELRAEDVAAMLGVSGEDGDFVLIRTEEDIPLAKLVGEEEGGEAEVFDIVAAGEAHAAALAKRTVCISADRDCIKGVIARAKAQRRPELTDEMQALLAVVAEHDSYAAVSADEPGLRVRAAGVTIGPRIRLDARHVFADKDAAEESLDAFRDEVELAKQMMARHAAEDGQKIQAMLSLMEELTPQRNGRELTIGADFGLETCRSVSEGDHWITRMTAEVLKGLPLPD